MSLIKKFLDSGLTLTERVIIKFTKEIDKGKYDECFSFVNTKGGTVFKRDGHLLNNLIVKGEFYGEGWSDYKIFHPSIQQGLVKEHIKKELYKAVDRALTRQEKTNYITKNKVIKNILRNT